MTEGNHYPSAAAQPAPQKPSIWQRFKRWPLIARISTIGCGGLIVLFLLAAVAAGCMAVIDPDGTAERQDATEEREAEREAEQAREQQEEEEAEAERQAEEEAEAERLEQEAQEAEEEAEREAEEERQREEKEAAEEEAEAAEDELPDGIDAQIAALSDVRDFEDAAITHHDGVVMVEVEVGAGWSESSMCRSAREQTIRGLQFFRDNVDEEYQQVGFSYFARSEEDATGDSSILPMAGAYYNYDTVQSIQDDAVTISNVWDAVDEGGEALVCQRAG